MATATKAKRKVNQSTTVSVSGNTVADILEGQSFVGAPDTASVVLNQNQPQYNPEPPAEGAEPEEFYPYAITFSWTEEK